MMVRAAVDPLSLAGAVIGEVRALDPAQAPFDVATMDRRVANTVAPSRFSALLLTLFAGSALLLAAIGIYGVLAYSISQRTGEIGVRTALGARRADVVRMVVRQGMAPALWGVGGGLALAFGGTRLMQSLLFEVGAIDGWVFSGVVAIIVTVAFVACLVPALRATRVNPVEALRYE